MSLVNVRQSQMTPDSQQLFLPPAGTRDCAYIGNLGAAMAGTAESPQRQHLQMGMYVLPCTVAPRPAHHCTPLLRDTLVHPGRGHHPDVHASLHYAHTTQLPAGPLGTIHTTQVASRVCGSSATPPQALAKSHVLTATGTKGVSRQRWCVQTAAVVAH